MERSGVKVLCLMFYLIGLIFTQNVNAQVYTCLGGCYNQCILATGTNASAKQACYVKCLKSCVPVSAKVFNSYCQKGCALKLCSSLINDGALMAKCLGKCSNVCEVLN